MRAATALASLLKTGAAPIWQAGEIAPGGVFNPGLPSGFAALDAELPGGGWPQGQLVELLLDTPGVGELSLLTPALARVACDRPCVWVLPYDSAVALPYPPALGDAGIATERSIFVKPATPRESLWAIEQSLRTAHLGALIGWLPASSARDEEGEEISSRAARGRSEQRTCTQEYSEQRRSEIGLRSRKIPAFGDFRALRRLHLLAQRSRALVFLLRAARAAATASPASLRLQLACADGRLHVTVLKRRGWPLLEPVTLQVHPAHLNEARVQTRLPEPLARSRIVVDGAPALPTRRWSLPSIFSH